MNRATEKTFKSIAEKFLGECDRVSCPLQDFKAGLELIIDSIQERIDCVEEELRAKGNEE